MEEYRALGMMELKSIARGYEAADQLVKTCLLYTSPSPRD